MELHLIHYALFAVMAASAVFFILPKVKRFLNAFKGDFQEKKNSNLSAEQKWALLTGAILSERNGQFINTLETGLDKQFVREKLADFWGVRSTKETLETLEYLQEEGHRKKYHIVAEIIKNYEQDQWKSISDKIDGSGDLYESVVNLFNGLLELQKEKLITIDDFNRLSILSWDYGRLVNNCRWCFDARYITEDQAWSYILPAAEVLQKEYSSWEDLAKGYLLGRAMWGGVEGDFSVVNDIAKGLLSKEKSPWKQTPWAITVNA